MPPLVRSRATGSECFTSAVERPLRPLWHQPAFLRFWGAQAVSQFGTHFSALALPLIAATLLNASALEVGILAALSWLPFLLFGLFAGVWVDRWPRRPVMIGADIGRAAIVALVPIVWLLGRLSLEVLYAVALLAGSLTVFFDVAYLSYLPTLIDRRQLVAGNSRIEATTSAAQIIGPGAGGVLIGILGGPLAVLLDAVSFLGSGLVLWRIRTPEPPPVPRPGERTIWADIGEGVAFVRRSSMLRALVLASSTVQAAGFAFLAVDVLFMARDLGLNAAQIGLVLATGGFGALAAALIAEPAKARFGPGPTIVGALFAFGATGLLVPLAVLVPERALPPGRRLRILPVDGHRRLRCQRGQSAAGDRSRRVGGKSQWHVPLPRLGSPTGGVPARGCTGRHYRPGRNPGGRGDRHARCLSLALLFPGPATHHRDVQRLSQQ